MLWSNEVWLAEFPFLKFRQVRQPPECATCIKHKLLIRGLGRHLLARSKQEAQYHVHLNEQYADRVHY